VLATETSLRRLFRRNGRFTGFPVLGVKWQRMESAGLRASYGLNAPLKGVLIRSIWPTSPLARAARPDDIIMRFDGTQVACDGTVPFRCARGVAWGKASIGALRGKPVLVPLGCAGPNNALQGSMHLGYVRVGGWHKGCL
jgi:hypothetical protein